MLPKKPCPCQQDTQQDTCLQHTHTHTPCQPNNTTAIGCSASTHTPTRTGAPLAGQASKHFKQAGVVEGDAAAGTAALNTQQQHSSAGMPAYCC
jgi:hypothetical protein